LMSLLSYDHFAKSATYTPVLIAGAFSFQSAMKQA
jgi:hypothetical protein